MLLRFELGLKPQVRDVVGERVARKIKNELGLELARVGIVRVYTVEGLDAAQARAVIDAGALHDPVLHEISLSPLAKAGDFNWVLEVGFRPGVTDNEAKTARETLLLVLGLSGQAAKAVSVYTSVQYLLKAAPGAGLDEKTVLHIARDLLANELIQRFELKSAAQWASAPGFEPKAARVTGQASDEVAVVPLTSMADEELVAFSRANTLALSLGEMKTIVAYYKDPAVRAARKEAGLPAALVENPTDAEVEVLAQTWSEHCKHKIFTAKIDYEDADKGTRRTVDSLYKTCIKGSTQAIRQAKGKDDFCLSVFKDNAGVIRFNDNLNVCIKVETHNSPSALDPYGGALTGIVGVNRDPMGTGLGANLLCNTDVFCFASPFYEGELPPRLLHPRRVLEGVREGVEHGGNKSGIPTVNGAIVFDERYLGKPLVYCGTVGTMPTRVAGRLSHEKCAKPGDVIEVGGVQGRIAQINARYTSIETLDGKAYLIPNENLISNEVINVSYSDSQQLLKAEVGVAYGGDPRQAIALMEQAAGSVPRVLKDPAPAARIAAFGDSSVNLFVGFWIDDPENGTANVRSDVLLAIWDAFKQAGVEIPFPQREVRVLKDAQAPGGQSAGKP